MGLFSAKPKLPLEVQLSEKNKKLRLVLICVFLAIGIGAFAVALASLLSIEEGWQTIESGSSQRNCGDDLVFQYYFENENGTPTSAYRTLSTLYSELSVNAYALFTADAEGDLLNGIAYLNAHPNETVTVAPELYEALALLQSHSSRGIYLAPLNAMYTTLCFSETDVQAAYYDPTRSEDTAAYVAEVISYVSSDAHISLTLLSDNRVILSVSDAYLRFAADSGIDVFLDFGFMKNAFIADYIAENLQKNGYTNGYLASYDGFTRNLDTSGRIYAQNVIDRLGDSVYAAAVLQYAGETAIVSLRNYPLSDHDAWSYYSWTDGAITTPYIDESDGYCKTSTDNLLAYQRDASCAEMLLRLIPVYISDAFDGEVLVSLAENGLYAVYCEGNAIHTTGDPAALSNIYEGTDVSYDVATKK